MKPIEATDVVRLLAGYWPNPEMGEDEIRVWMRQLTPLECHRHDPCEDGCAINLSARIIDGLASTGRDFRPTAGQFVSEYSARAPRFKGTPINAPELEVTTEHLPPEEWQKRMRKELAEGHGPLAAPLLRSIPRNRGLTDAEAMAVARAMVGEREVVHVVSGSAREGYVFGERPTAEHPDA